MRYLAWKFPLHLGLILLGATAVFGVELARTDHSLAFAQTNPELTLSDAPAVEQLQASEADQLLQQGIDFIQSEEYSEAIATLEQTLHLYQGSGNRSGEASTLMYLGDASGGTEKYEQAIAYFQQALLIYRELGDRQGEVDALWKIGYASGFLGNYEQGREYFQQTLPIYQELSDRDSEARSLNYLGLASSRLEDYGQAIEYFLQALLILEQMGAGVERLEVLDNLSYAYYELEQYTEIIELHQRLLIDPTIADEREDALVKIAELYVEIHHDVGQYADAIAAYEQLFVTLRQHDPNVEAELRRHIADRYQDIDEALALEFYTQAIELYRTAENPVGEVSVLNRLARFYADQGNYTQAVEVYRQSLAIIQRVDASTRADWDEGNDEVSVLLDLASIYYQLGKVSEEVDAYQQALEVTRANGDIKREVEILAILGLTYHDSEQYIQALEVYQQALEQLLKIEVSGDRTELQNQLWRRIANTYEEIHGREREYPEAIAQFEQIQVTLQQSNTPEEEANLLVAIASELHQADSVDFYLRAIEIFRANSDSLEASTLARLAALYDDLRQVPESISAYQQAAEIYHQLEQYDGEVSALYNLAEIYGKLGEVSNEIETYQRVLAIVQEMGDLGQSWGTGGDELRTLLALGSAYSKIGETALSQETFQQGLSLIRADGDPEDELSTLREIADIYVEQQQYDEALRIHQQALLLVNDASVEDDNPFRLNPRVETLLDLSVIYDLLEDEQAAQQYYNDALAAARTTDGEVNAIYHLATVYADELNQYQTAIELYQTALNKLPVDNPELAIRSLVALGELYLTTGPYQAAVESYQSAIDIYEEGIDNPFIDSNDYLITLGNAYHRLGNYSEAIRIYEQALGTPAWDDGEETLLNALGASYRALGQYQQALELHQQALEMAQDLSGWDERDEEALTLDQLGLTYQALGDYQSAIAFHQQAWNVFNWNSERDQAATALDNLGAAYSALEDYETSITYHQQALEAFQTLQNRGGEASALNNLGQIHQALGRYDQAVAYYQQSLALKQEIGDRLGEGTTLANLGRLLAMQDQVELAIVFYKQSVNVRESIRNDIRGLSVEQQQSFTETIADDYRELADLLLQENRVLEAQRVLDLLKVQELDDYLQNVRGTSQTETGIDLLAPETSITNEAIAIGRELGELRRIPSSQLTSDQKERLSELDAAQRVIITNFLDFIESDEIQGLVAQLSADASEQDLLADLDELVNLQNNLRSLNQNAVLLYPLVLEDRLELVLVTPFSEPTRYPVEVDRATLNEAIVSFRQALEAPTSDPRPIAQQLYGWLVEPLAADLKAIGAETLIYSPDGVLRYVPLAALYDGEQWLTERFRINHITAASLQDFDLQPAAQPQVLAAAFSEGSFPVQVGDRQVPFEGLPFAGREVENLASLFPDTTQFLNEEFTLADTVPIMDNYTIVHLATHAAFVPGSPNDSFILFGNGDRVTLEEIKNGWRGRFNQVELMVLSACETGVSGPSLGNGEEILGFGYLMQEAGADAAIASLWSVNDGGTQILMNAFYSALNEGMTKTEALQQAQIALITGDLTAVGSPRGNGTIEFLSAETGLPAAVSSNLNHPYYWAPFILIGNGL